MLFNQSKGRQNDTYKKYVPIINDKCAVIIKLNYERKNMLTQETCTLYSVKSIRIYVKPLNYIDSSLNSCKNVQMLKITYINKALNSFMLSP